MSAFAECIPDCAVENTNLGMADQMYGDISTRTCNKSVLCRQRMPEQWQTSTGVTATADRVCQALANCSLGYYDSFYDIPTIDRTANRFCVQCAAGTTDLNGITDFKPCTVRIL